MLLVLLPLGKAVGLALLASRHAPASSASFMIQPPCTSPRRPACSGGISWLRATREAWTGFGVW